MLNVGLQTLDSLWTQFVRFPCPIFGLGQLCNLLGTVLSLLDPASHLLPFCLPLDRFLMTACILVRLCEIKNLSLIVGFFFESSLQHERVFHVLLRISVARSQTP